MKSHKFLAALGLVAPLLLGACDRLDDVLDDLGPGRPGMPPGPRPPQACTLIGCSDGLGVTIRPRMGLFPSGNHEVAVQADGFPAQTCTFAFPIPGGAGAIASGVCSGGVWLTVAPVMSCTTMTSGSTSSATCTPVPGQFEERIQVPGTPARVRVTQKVIGSAPYVDRTVDATYKDVYPNGIQCGAVCKQARVTWDF